MSARTIVLWASLAATSVAPAIVLTLPGGTMPIGPAIVSLSAEPDDSRPRAAALALAAISVNLAALAWAWSGRSRDRGAAWRLRTSPESLTSHGAVSFSHFDLTWEGEAGMFKVGLAL